MWKLSHGTPTSHSRWRTWFVIRLLVLLIQLSVNVTSHVTDAPLLTWEPCIKFSPPDFSPCQRLLQTLGSQPAHAGVLARSLPLFFLPQPCSLVCFFAYQQ